MSDLTRRTLEHSAPTLARQVEAVEKLADRLEWEADPDNHGGDEPDYCRLATAARIRDALNTTD